MCKRKRGMVEGRRWYNNGEVNIQLDPGVSIPEGFMPGMKRHPYTPEKNREIQDKMKKTCLQKYGVEWVNQSKVVVEKRVNTNRKKYGCDHGFQSEDVKEKIKQTNLRKYGVENVSQADEIKKKKIETSIRHYGTEYPLQSNEIKEKVKQTNIEKYGKGSYTQTEEYLEKAKRTNLERYGVEHAAQSKEIQEKTEQTNLERYNVRCTLMLEIARKRLKEVLRNEYGVEHALQSPIIQERVKQTNIERYGVDRPTKSGLIMNRVRESNLKRYGTEYSWQSEEVKEKISKTCMEHYGVKWYCMFPQIKVVSNNSRPNRKFARSLESKGLSYTREFPLESYSYDFKVGNTLIEIDPSATHNSLWNLFGRVGLSKDYHLNKTLTAEKHGYHCIHVFDWDKYDDIINKFLIQSKSDIEDLNQYFTQVSENVYALLESNIKHIHDIPEIIRKFKENNKEVSITITSDRSKFSSNFYKYLGCEIISEIPPVCNWYRPGTGELRVCDFDENKKELGDRGFVPIFDCGICTYILKSTYNIKR